ncbi:ubiquitin recognition factor in ER-associated degradation protein 1-like [Dreissena polymorpha]|uniref:ubiquitin recognition factor in ER-associated degradation protein 1-like n=1 Tax=Dreissena polymorpha TaxID=45954 RepID=UPI002264C5EF|nr:ubiquitin recognition factor in ER-associated degradation protein 1-like [Dreissena polymorpha]
MFQFGRMFPTMPSGRNFSETYRCYSVTMLGDRDDVERGGKIIMPPSALDKLTRLHIQYPMLFKMTNRKQNRETHCGVLEFVADEGRIYIPYWMMKNLLLQEGDLIQVDNVSLPIATFAKFQPQHTDFLDISNPKAVLENALRSFACLTVEDLIEFKYNDKMYELRVLETKPGRAVSIIECDMNVDFAPPLGYKEPERVMPHAQEPNKMEEEDIEPDCDSFQVFKGRGNRLDGKTKGLDTPDKPILNVPPKRGIPNYNYKKNTITFIRTSRRVENGAQSPEDKMFEAFSGEGQSLRKTKTKSRK